MIYVRRDKSSDRTLDIANTGFTLEPFVTYAFPPSIWGLPTRSSLSTRTIEPGENRRRLTGRDDPLLSGQSDYHSSLRGIAIVNIRVVIAIGVQRRPWKIVSAIFGF